MDEPTSAPTLSQGSAMFIFVGGPDKILFENCALLLEVIQLLVFQVKKIKHRKAHRQGTKHLGAMGALLGASSGHHHGIRSRGQMGAVPHPQVNIQTELALSRLHPSCRAASLLLPQLGGTVTSSRRRPDPQSSQPAPPFLDLIPHEGLHQYCPCPYVPGIPPSAST